MKYLDKAALIQGDVILKQIDKLPQDAKLVTEKTKILQHSEVTGHHHQFLPESNVKLYQVPAETIPGIATITENQGKIIVVLEPSFLYHGKEFDLSPATTGTGDHNAILVDPGTYVIDIVREYDYEFNEITRVVD